MQGKSFVCMDGHNRCIGIQTSLIQSHTLRLWGYKHPYKGIHPRIQGYIRRIQGYQTYNPRIQGHNHPVNSEINTSYKDMQNSVYRNILGSYFCKFEVQLYILMGWYQYIITLCNTAYDTITTSMQQQFISVAHIQYSKSWVQASVTQNKIYKAGTYCSFVNYVRSIKE